MDSAQMPRNGSGVYSLPSGYEATTGQTAEASQHNSPLEDIKDDLNTARPIVVGGTGATTASGARTNLAVPGKAANDTITGGWTVSGNWTITGTWDMSGSTLTLPDDVVTLGKIADAALSGSDATLITGTAGTNGNLAQWNGDGDLVDGPDVLDEDDMASDSDGAVPTQQSVKAYADTQFGTANAPGTKTALNASGSAPIYACRAWVNFNGTGTVAIRASGNVSSITDNGTGNYTVNFTTAMPDANYAVSAQVNATATVTIGVDGQTTTDLDLTVQAAGVGAVDMSNISVIVFR